MEFQKKKEKRRMRDKRKWISLWQWHNNVVNIYKYATIKLWIIWINNCIVEEKQQYISNIILTLYDSK